MQLEQDCISPMIPISNHVSSSAIIITVSHVQYYRSQKKSKLAKKSRLIQLPSEISYDLFQSQYNIPQHSSPSTMIEPVQIPRAHFDNSQSKFWSEFLLSWGVITGYHSI